MCAAPAVGREHVPPRCFFPKAKDLGAGQDLRKELQTVPSCELHNSAKSKDDEYFLNVVTSLEAINEVGRNHYCNQIRRQNQRNPSIIARFAERAVKVDEKFGHEIETQRVDSFISHFACALYFLHLSEKWEGDISFIPEFAARPPNSQEESERLQAIEEIDHMFRDAVFFGENPSVFKYQVVTLRSSIQMRIHFYEGCKIFLDFEN